MVLHQVSIMNKTVLLKSTKSFGLEGISGGHLVIWSSLPGQDGSARAGCAGLHPDGFWISPRTTTPQPHWATCASVHLPSQLKCFIMFRQDPLRYSLCLMPLVLLLGITEKSLTRSCLHPPMRYLFILFILSLRFSSLNSLIAQPFFIWHAPIP